MTPRLIRIDAVVTGLPKKKFRAWQKGRKRQFSKFRTLGMNKKKATVSAATVDQLQRLKDELATVRHQSLQATRRGDFMRVARCTAQAQQINKAIADLEGILIEAGSLPSDYPAA